MVLGLSGGVDSLALFHLLLAYRKKGRLDLRVAHIDHRWRPESEHEAAALEKLAHREEIPFYLEVLQGGRPSRNAEDIARQARLDFFERLCQQIESQAVLLGHHADDLAETTLKRLFEGASLTHGAAMRPTTWVGSVRLWRPLLKVTKRDLAAWLQQQSIIPFEDSTNHDPHFLRTRMRQDILPMLSQSFGKEVTTSLCAIADECQDIKANLTWRLDHWLGLIQQDEQGHSLDCTGQGVLDNVEVKFLIRYLCECEGFVLSRQALETACEMFLLRKANRKVAMGKNVLSIDRGVLRARGATDVESKKRS